MKPPRPQPTPQRPGIRLAAGVCLLAGAVLSGVLVAGHLGNSVPGCGPASPCAAAAHGRFGTVPGTDIPTSFMGLLYFVVLLAGLIAGRGRPTDAMRWFARVGGVASVFLLGALLGQGHICPYCLGVHAASLLFIAAMELAPRAAPGRSWSVPAMGVAAVLCAALLTYLETAHTIRARAAAEARLAQSTSEIISRPATQPEPRGFEGRYRSGPEKAAVRIVLFTGYQCPDCARVETELAELMGAGLDLSVSVKHFPLSTMCNPHAPGELHANACWAAYAAEAAGSLGGPDAFWRMHRWLFARGGSFTEAELDAGVHEIGMNPGDVTRMMEHPAVRRAVEADIADAMAVGIYSTPMIFINGVELRGWNAERALTRAVQAVLASNPAPASAASDIPPTAAERAVNEWREAPDLGLRPGTLRHAVGSADSRVGVVIIGDYQEPFTSEADSLMRLFATGLNANIRYAFVHYPVNQACNPVAQMTLHADGCTAALAAEAATVLDGEEGFWRVHQWLLTHQSTLAKPQIIAAATEIGFDPAQLADAMDQPFVADRVADDCRLAGSLGITAVPMILVNGKHVPRWRIEYENILPRIISEAELLP